MASSARRSRSIAARCSASEAPATCCSSASRSAVSRFTASEAAVRAEVRPVLREPDSLKKRSNSACARSSTCLNSGSWASAESARVSESRPDSARSATRLAERISSGDPWRASSALAMKLTGMPLGAPLPPGDGMPQGSRVRSFSSTARAFSAGSQVRRSFELHSWAVPGPPQVFFTRQCFPASSHSSRVTVGRWSTDQG
ncbi:MAG: hypothetical protein IPJ65_15305 [Archangiaceae bacterium]|nr:hypothetical protein [Archangiaceae bacterium]